VNTHSTLCFPFYKGEQVAGGLYVSFTQQRKVSERERELLFVIALLCSQALTRIEATRQLQDDILEQERKRLARELHDAVSQALFSATSLAETLPQLLTKHYASGLEQLNMVIRLNRAALSEMRILLLELQPESLLKNPLSALVRQLIEGAQGRKRTEIDYHCTGNEVPLPPELHIAFYRIVQEGLNNIIKHSEARRAVVTLTYEADGLRLQIFDDGKGFDPAEVFAGMGIMGMRERARALGLTLELKSQPGHGTELRLQWRHTLEK
jgi:signal transduction histidine kinase